MARWRSALVTARRAASTSASASRRAFPLRVVVGMSGGVDSSVSAFLLKRAGFEVIGCFMRNWDRGDESGAGLEREPCTVEQDFKSAQAVAEQLAISLHRVDFVHDYWSEVFVPFLRDYQAGITPNPDTLCNRYIKFGAFRDHVLRTLGADCVATGHYAQLQPNITDPWASLPVEHLDVWAEASDGSTERMLQSSRPPVRAPQLLAAVDGSKDQSDFLSLVSPTALRRVIFPVGGMLKKDVRALASAHGLAPAERKDSYGFCFVGKRPLTSFLQDYVDLHPGSFVDITNGRTVGECAAVESVTVGQGARIASQATRYFVVTSDLHVKAGAGQARRPTVLVCPSQNHRALFSDWSFLRLDGVNWHAGWSPAELQAALWMARERKAAVLSAAQSAADSPAYTPSAATVDTLASWLRNASSQPPFPVQPLCFRDRHRQNEMLQATATVAWASEAHAACCTLLASNQADGHDEDIMRRVAVWRSAMQTAAMQTAASDAAPGAAAAPDADFLVLIVKFTAPRRAVTPGQVMVLYAAGDALGPAPAGGNTSGQGEPSWTGASRPCLGAAPVLCAGPSRWERGLQVEAAET